MNKPQEVTLKELVMVKDSIIYPVILDVLERDIGKMKLIDLKIRMIYINNLKHIQNLVTYELTEIKKELSKRGIKILEQKKSKEGITAKYICRGYNHQVSFLPDMIRTCVVVKVCVLLRLDFPSGGVL
jgi:Cu2+-containing amine oxidase